MVHTIVHFEIPADDVERAKKFYQQLFGWEIQAPQFEYRFNRRKASDAERFASLMGQTQGRILWYCQTPQPENPHA